MPNPSGTAIFYAVLIAPGFVAVATAIALAAVEREHSRFTLLVWSLVLSIVIDAISVFAYQSLAKPIQSFDQMASLLFDPGIRIEYIFFVLLLSVLIGSIGAVFLLLSIPERARQLLQSRANVVVNPRQPWANFIRETHSVRIKTSDDQTYEGLVSEWSRADRQKELRVADPYILDEEEETYKPVGGKSMLFLEDDIDRLVMREIDRHPSILQRLPLLGSNDSGNEQQDTDSENETEHENNNA